MKNILFVLIPSILLLSGCRKDGKGCWQGWNVIGQEDATGILVCDETKSGAESQFPGVWFYRQGETKYCYRTTSGSNTLYWANIPESIKDLYAANGQGPFTKIDCSSFCRCTWLEKQKNKLNNQFGPTRQYIETLTTADTCSKLFIGRIIIVRETADSLITRELIDKKP